MSTPIPKPALGSLNGLKIIGRPDFFPQYGIEPLDEPCPVIDHFLTIAVVITNSRIHYFYALEKKHVHALGEALSFVKRADVKILCKSKELIRWNCGQVVLGKRSLKYFDDRVSWKEERKSQF
jgi:hypothetical protein